MEEGHQPHRVKWPDRHQQCRVPLPRSVWYGVPATGHGGDRWQWPAHVPQGHHTTHSIYQWTMSPHSQSSSTKQLGQHMTVNVRYLHTPSKKDGWFIKKKKLTEILLEYSLSCLDPSKKNSSKAFQFVWRVYYAHRNSLLYTTGSFSGWTEFHS